MINNVIFEALIFLKSYQILILEQVGKYWIAGTIFYMLPVSFFLNLELGTMIAFITLWLILLWSAEDVLCAYV